MAALGASQAPARGPQGAALWRARMHGHQWRRASLLQRAAGACAWRNAACRCWQHLVECAALVVHQLAFALLWATVYVLMSACRLAWREQGAVWCSVHAALGIEWRSECAGMGPWGEREGRFLNGTVLKKR